MTARTETMALMQRFSVRGINLGFEEVNILRRAEITLQRWAEMECGDSHGCIYRDEQTGKPWYNRYSHTYLDPHDPRAHYRIPDREKGALKRIESVCKSHGLYYYHQTDPRGCALYISNKPLDDQNYTNGVSCCL